MWRSTPAHYLEKIFQIPLTLAPLTKEGYAAMVEDLTGIAEERGQPEAP